MAVRKNRPDDVPLDFSFLSDNAESPQVTNEQLADSAQLLTPDAGLFQSLNTGDIAPGTAIQSLTSSPVETSPVESLPVESLPVESLPVESLPVESLPVESLPVESLPVESLPVESPSVESPPVESPPVESPPIQSSLAESVLVDSMSVESVLDDSMAEERISDPSMPVVKQPAGTGSDFGNRIIPPRRPESSSTESTSSNQPQSPPAPRNHTQGAPENPASAKAERQDSAARRAGQLPGAVVGYALALTLFFLFCLFTGRFSLSGNHALESLPDIRPLPPNEFRKVPDGTNLPNGHIMKLGEARRFGDVVLTPVRVTREPLTFQHFLTGKGEDFLTTEPVLKLWLSFENVAANYGFPPFDVGLMSHRAPRHATSLSAAVNSFLTVAVPSDDKPETRVLNYLHTMDSEFILTGQDSARIVLPGETLNTFTACAEDISLTNANGETEYTWRVQFRKGVHQSSGNGVTTLVDVKFHGSDISEETITTTEPATPGAG